MTEDDIWTWLVTAGPEEYCSMHRDVLGLIMADLECRRAEVAELKARIISLHARGER